MTYQPGIRRKQGGEILEVDDGAKIDVLSGGIIEVSNGGDINVLSGGEIDIASGATLDVNGALDLANATAVTFPGNLAIGIIPLPILNWRKVASNAVPNTAANGGVLSSDTTPILERVNGATDKAVRIDWATTVVEELHQQFAYPPDLDDGAVVEVHLMIAKSTNTDVAAVVSVGYFEGVGDTNAGGDTAALAVDTLTEYTVTIAAAAIAAFPNFAVVTLTPGAHANDAVYLYNAWIEYTRKTV